MVSDKCKDLIYRLIQYKELRLCSRHYLIKDRGQMKTGQPVDCFGRFVFPNDAEDIKAHLWFRHFPWDRIHTVSPPFVPNLSSMEDTHYFDESEPVESFTNSSCPPADLTPEDVRAILHEYRPPVQDVAIELMSEHYDSTRLRSADQEIDSSPKVTSGEGECSSSLSACTGEKSPDDRGTSCSGTGAPKTWQWRCGRRRRSSGTRGRA